MDRLAGKVALITGGASGIGLAIAARLRAEGAQVVIGDIDRAAGDAVCRAEPQLHFESLDVTDDGAWRGVTERVLARFGGIDILVNNAGVVTVGTIESISLEEWRRVQGVNVDGTFLGCRHAVRVMRPPSGRGGSIINMSSVSGIVGGHNLVAYNAAKGAVRLLTKSVALHCARKGYGIRCNSIHPGFIETGMLDDLAVGRDPEALRDKLRASVPLGRNGQPEEVAALAAYLASEESSFVTGAELVIDGGVTAM